MTTEGTTAYRAEGDVSIEEATAHFGAKMAAMELQMLSAKYRMAEMRQTIMLQAERIAELSDLRVAPPVETTPARPLVAPVGGAQKENGHGR